ncbi:MAG: nucleotidyltransferase family protein, partial [Candidatus Limnocylindria bacterium]
MRSAVEQRMAGLLWTRVATGELALPQAERDLLREEDLRTWGRHRILWDALADLARRLAAMGVEFAVAKGVIAEARWYGRVAERPSSDIDLLVAPHDVGRVGAVLAELSPQHRLRGAAQALVDAGQLQSIDLWIGQVPIDLHTDLLKLGIVGSRQRHLIWERTRLFPLPSGGTVRVPDAEMSLIHFLLHLNKDSFARLLGFADVARICAREKLDWDFIDAFARREGLAHPLYLTLEVVRSTLGLAEPARAAPGGWRATAWRLLWPPSVRLRGESGRVRFRHRQLWLGLSAPGRTAAALRGLLRLIFPPPALLTYFFPRARGPYLLRLAQGRLGEALRRRRSFSALARLTP